MSDYPTVICRLVTGEDIIGSLRESDPAYLIMSPYKVITRRITSGTVGVALTPWLPDELLDDHMIRMERSHVLCLLYPKQEFIDYYHRLCDEQYMYMLNHDQDYRNQLVMLQQKLNTSSFNGSMPLSDFPDPLASSLFGTTDPFDMDTENEEDDSSNFGPPTFH